MASDWDRSVKGLQPKSPSPLFSLKVLVAVVFAMHAGLIVRSSHSTLRFVLQPGP